MEFLKSILIWLAIGGGLVLGWTARDYLSKPAPLASSPQEAAAPAASLPEQSPSSAAAHPHPSEPAEATAAANPTPADSAPPAVAALPPAPEAAPAPVAPQRPTAGERALVISDTMGTTTHGKLRLQRGMQVDVVSTTDSAAVVFVAGQNVTVPANSLQSFALPMVATANVSTTQPPVDLRREPAAPENTAPMPDTISPAPVNTPAMPETPSAEPPAPLANAAPKILATVGIDVKEVGTSKAKDRKSTPWWVYYNNDIYRSKALSINVRNVSRNTAGDCEVAVYWIGQDVQSKALGITHAETLDFTAGPMSSAEAMFWSPLVKSNEHLTVYDSKKRESGLKIDGWMVIVWRDGEPITGRGSSNDYNKFLSNSASLKELVRAYVPSGMVATSERPQWRKDSARSTFRGGEYHEPKR